MIISTRIGNGEPVLIDSVIARDSHIQNTFAPCGKDSVTNGFSFIDPFLTTVGDSDVNSAPLHFDNIVPCG